MRYLSIDLEATGLREHDSIIEFAMAPFCTKDKTIATPLCRSVYVKCESFESLKPTLDPWVIEHNEALIKRAHCDGLSLPDLQKFLVDYLTSPAVTSYFGTQTGQKIILLGKSMNALDLPFLNRDLGWEFMRKYFHHQVLDLSSVVRAFVDKGLLPPETVSGSALMKHLKMGDVAHTALEDAMNVAKIYLKLLT
ncbi:MAG: hypothetical protein A2X86_19860 [Bdellovibrionales bacterium GWA2_49_15]|nr:MAG: hypothetical protein A2X86_19860 [Bdellovibrionales bacterium GWA2_49_15]HAZ12516.1 hypothetical protein [Bdellovibrionales bacterium]